MWPLAIHSGERFRMIFAEERICFRFIQQTEQSRRCKRSFSRRLIRVMWLKNHGQPRAAAFFQLQNIAGDDPRELLRLSVGG